MHVPDQLPNKKSLILQNAYAVGLFAAILSAFIIESSPGILLLYFFAGLLLAYISLRDSVRTESAYFIVISIALLLAGIILNVALSSSAAIMYLLGGLPSTAFIGIVRSLGGYDYRKEES